MFVILSYDVNQKRVSKVMKICRKYLVHVQKSIFEGFLTGAEIEKLKNELKNAIEIEKDSICVYQLPTTKYLKKEQIGVTEYFSNII